MKILFKILTIFPLKIGFYLIECLLFVVPINFLQLLPPFQVTKKNLAVAFPVLSTTKFYSFQNVASLKPLKVSMKHFTVGLDHQKKLLHKQKK